MNELYRPELNQELLELVNEPLILSLLYDSDLLPEQLSSQKEMTVGLFAAYNRLEGVLLAFKCLEMNGISWNSSVQVNPAHQNAPRQK